MKKLLVLGLVAGTAAAALTGCGPKNDKTLSIIRGKDDVIVFGTAKTVDREHWNAISAVVKEYNAQNGDGLDVELMSYAAGSAGQAAEAGGQVPDIVEIYGDELSKIYSAENNYVHNLEKSDFDKSLIHSGFLQEGYQVSSSKLLAVPYLKSLQLTGVNRNIMNAWIATVNAANGITSNDCLGSNYEAVSCSVNNDLIIVKSDFDLTSNEAKESANWDNLSSTAGYSKLVNTFAKAIDQDAYGSNLVSLGYQQVKNSAGEYLTSAEVDALDSAGLLALIRSNNQYVDLANFAFSTQGDDVEPNPTNFGNNGFFIQSRNGTRRFATENNMRTLLKDGTVAGEAAYKSVESGKVESGEMYAVGVDSLSNDLMYGAFDRANGNYEGFMWNEKGNYDSFEAGTKNAYDATLGSYFDAYANSSIKVKTVTDAYNSNWFNANSMLMNHGSTAGAGYLVDGKKTSASDMLYFANPSDNGYVVQQGPNLALLNVGNDKRKAASIDFLNYLVKGENLEKIAGATGYMPASASSFDTGSAGSNYKSMITEAGKLNPKGTKSVVWDTATKTWVEGTGGTPEYRLVNIAKMTSKSLEIVADTTNFKLFTYPTNAYSSTMRTELESQLAAIMRGVSNGTYKTSTAAKEAYVTEMMKKKNSTIGAE